MKAPVDKTSKNKSQVPINENVPPKRAGEALAHFNDNRPKTKQLQQLQGMADQFTAQTQSPVQKKKNHTGLPDNLKSGIENLSGISMDDVKVHRNSDKPAQLNAHAYAQGTDIHLASGQEKHLPHEAWHVVQQKQGRVKPTMQLKNKVNINDDVGLEKEADVMGAKALGTDLKVKENEIQLKSLDQKSSKKNQLIQSVVVQKANSQKGMAISTNGDYGKSNSFKNTEPVQFIKGFLQNGDGGMEILYKGVTYTIQGVAPLSGGPVEFDSVYPPGFGPATIATNVRPDLSTPESIKWWADIGDAQAIELLGETEDEVEEEPEKVMTLAEIMKASGPMPKSLTPKSGYNGPPLVKKINKLSVHAPGQVSEGKVVKIQTFPYVGDLVLKCEVTLSFSKGTSDYKGMLCIHQHQNGNLNNTDNLHFKKTHSKTDKKYGRVPRWVIDQVPQIQ